MSRKPSTKHDAPDAETIGFEEAVAQLEQIIDRIESGEVDLERSLKEYERGVALLRRCRSILDKAEQRVKELSVEAASADGPAAAPAKPPVPLLEDSDDEETPF